MHECAAKDWQLPIGTIWCHGCITKVQSFEREKKQKEKTDFLIWHPLEITEYKTSLHSVLVPLRIPLWFSPTVDFQPLKQKQACLSFLMKLLRNKVALLQLEQHGENSPIFTYRTTGFQPSECALGVTINSMLSSGQKNKLNARCY